MTQAINEHLPRTVKVLSLQRVNKGFDARERCGERTYHYWLPISAGGITMDGARPSSTVGTGHPGRTRQCCWAVQAGGRAGRARNMMLLFTMGRAMLQLAGSTGADRSL